MATIKKHANPINIAPFVDILLVLFVILVVVARFDGEKAVKTFEHEYKSLLKEKDELVAKIQTLVEQKNDKEKEKATFEAQEKKKLEDDTAAKKSLDNYLLKKGENDKKIEQMEKQSKDKDAEIKRYAELNKDREKLVVDARKEIAQLKNEKKKLEEASKSAGINFEIDTNGKIWLVNPSARIRLLEVDEDKFSKITASITNANILYQYDNKSAESLRTMRKLGLKGEKNEAK